MNFLNRILIVFVTLAIMTISLLLFLQALQISATEIIGISLSQIVWLLSISESDFRTRLAFGSICLSVFIVGAVLIYIELHPLLSKEPSFLVFKDEIGKVEISESSVNKFINYEARHFEGVLSANSHIKEQKEGLYIKTEITVGPETKVFEVAKDMQNALKSRMQEKLGLHVSEIAIKTKVQESNTSARKLN